MAARLLVLFGCCEALLWPGAPPTRGFLRPTLARWNGHVPHAVVRRPESALLAGRPGTEEASGPKKRRGRKAAAGNGGEDERCRYSNRRFTLPS